MSIDTQPCCTPLPYSKDTMDRQIEAQPVDRTVNRGDIYWVAADPAKGAVPGVPHPHLVVQDDVFNHSRIGTVIVCALSSNLRKAAEPGNVLLDPGEGGLMRQSVVVSSQVSCIYKARIGDRIGALSPERVDQVIAGLRFVQRVFHQPSEARGMGDTGQPSR